MERGTALESFGRAPTPLAAAKLVLRREGFRGLWAGYSAAIALQEFTEISTDQQLVRISAWWRQWWTDPRLAWDATNATRLLLLSFFALAPNLAPLFTDVITARQEQALALIAAFIGGGSALLVDYVARVSFVHRLLLEAHGGAIPLAAQCALNMFGRCSGLGARITVWSFRALHVMFEHSLRSFSRSHACWTRAVSASSFGLR